MGSTKFSTTKNYEDALNELVSGIMPSQEFQVGMVARYEHPQVAMALFLLVSSMKLMLLSAKELY